eukprot:scaffold243859_cov19-Tisochrysis_lutea.AAC.1
MTDQVDIYVPQANIEQESKEKMTQAKRLWTNRGLKRITDNAIRPQRLKGCGAANKLATNVHCFDATKILQANAEKPQTQALVIGTAPEAISS